MKDERQRNGLTKAEISAAIADRKRKSIFGWVFAIGGFTMAMGSMWYMESIAWATFWMVIALVGAGYANIKDVQLPGT